MACSWIGSAPRIPWRRRRRGACPRARAPRTAGSRPRGPDRKAARRARAPCRSCRRPGRRGSRSRPPLSRPPRSRRDRGPGCCALRAADGRRSSHARRSFAVVAPGGAVAGRRWRHRPRPSSPAPAAPEPGPGPARRRPARPGRRLRGGACRRACGGACRRPRPEPRLRQRARSGQGWSSRWWVVSRVSLFLGDSVRGDVPLSGAGVCSPGIRGVRGSSSCGGPPSGRPDSVRTGVPFNSRTLPGNHNVCGVCFGRKCPALCAWARNRLPWLKQTLSALHCTLKRRDPRRRPRSGTSGRSRRLMRRRASAWPRTCGRRPGRATREDPPAHASRSAPRRD